MDIVTLIDGFKEGTQCTQSSLRMSGWMDEWKAGRKKWIYKVLFLYLTWNITDH